MPDGRYRFVTVKPGAVPLEGNRWQAPHILVSLFAAGLLRRLVTRLYFPDEPANESDPILATVDDPEARATPDRQGRWRGILSLRHRAARRGRDRLLRRLSEGRS